MFLKFNLPPLSTVDLRPITGKFLRVDISKERIFSKLLQIDSMIQRNASKRFAASKTFKFGRAKSDAKMKIAVLSFYIQTEVVNIPQR